MSVTDNVCNRCGWRLDEREMAAVPRICPFCGDAEPKLLAKLPDWAEQFRAIESLCRQYNHPGVNPSTHELAGKILEILESTQ